MIVNKHFIDKNSLGFFYLSVWEEYTYRILTLYIEHTILSDKNFNLIIYQVWNVCNKYLNGQSIFEMKIEKEINGLLNLNT